MKAAIRWAMIPVVGVLAMAANAIEGQHSSHDPSASAQMKPASQDTKGHSMEDLRAVVRAARATNDVAKMRAALADVEAHFAQMDRNMSGCKGMSEHRHDANMPMGSSTTRPPGSKDHH